MNSFTYNLSLLVSLFLKSVINIRDVNFPFTLDFIPSRVLESSYNSLILSYIKLFKANSESKSYYDSTRESILVYIDNFEIS